MKTKKQFKYHLKNDVRYDLIRLSNKLDNLLVTNDLEGFDSIPSCSILPALFRVYSHLVWCSTFQSWFKKVYF